MIAYVDSSVVLRIVLGQSGRLRQWKDVTDAVVSALVEVECLRTLDRLRLREAVPEREVALRREAVYQLLGEMYEILPDKAVLSRAAQPLPNALGTLDAIHLASAMLWREQQAAELVMATHDEALALAARACGMDVIGV
jgi:predicted nucleic acid-binding protein